MAGAEGAARGECEALHDLVVAWAMAQDGVSAARRLAYEGKPASRGSEWAAALVQTKEDGDTLRVESPELYVPTRETYIEENGTAALPFLDDDFFGNHYCKIISPARALAWLTGS